jgi:pimeloyl-ACP methyl ester carboxylesterase
MMRNALESLVAEMAGLATADHRRRDFEVSKATQAGQRGDDRWHVTDLIFGQVTGFRARVGDKQTEWRLQLIAMAQTGGFKSVRDILWPLFVHPARHDDVALKRAVFKMMDDTGTETLIRQEKAIMSRPDSRPSLGVIRCPTLVLVGNEDALTPVSAARMIAERIVGSKLDIVQDCGHLSTMERPDAVTEALRARIAL